MTKSCIENDAELCMKCGFCMSVCPVYRADQVESHVARGRNTLINWAEKGMIESDKSFREALSFCILCHRCEQICPAGVPSTAITLKAREKAVKQHGLPLIQRLAYQGVLKHRSFMAKILETVSRLHGLFDKKAIPIRHLADIYSLLSKGFYVPPLSNPFLSRLLPERISPPKEIKPKGEVAFFPGCAFEFFFADIGRKTIEVIVNAGFEVVYPHGLSCCGMAVHNAGDADTARSMAIRNIKILKGFDYIVSGCATCTSALKDYPNWFSDDSLMQKEAKAVSEHTQDFSEFFCSEGVALENSYNSHKEEITVTYHDPCHLRWNQGIIDQPRTILKQIKGIRYIEMDGADRCCGLGGSFGISHRQESLAIQKKKMDAIQDSGAQAVITSCPGCMIQLMDGVRRYGMDTRVLHISELMHDKQGLTTP